ncbi:MAG: hypothetical protein QXG16_04590 [Candidatus Anstonellaceae archaeon]
MARVCIICEKEILEGYRVKESAILNFIKKIKSSLKILKNNELYVCSNCLEEYKKRKKKFNNTLVLNSVVGILLLVALVIIPLVFNQEIRLDGFVVMIFLMGFLFLISLFSYVPDIEEQKQTFSQNTSISSNPYNSSMNLVQEGEILATTSLVPASPQPPLQPLELSQKTEQIKQDISNAILSASLSAKKITKKKKSKKKKSKSPHKSKKSQKAKTKRMKKTKKHKSKKLR